MRVFPWIFSALLVGCTAVSPAEGPPPHPPAIITAGPTVSVPIAPVQPTSDSIPVAADDPVRGKATAPVTLVAFLDLECPYCASAEQTLERLRQRYGDQLRIVFKHFPLEFHHRAMPAARVAQAVYRVGGAPAFFRFVTAAYDNQSALSDDNLRTWAERSGVAPAALDQALRDPAVNAAIQADMLLGAKLGVTGTPEFLINGRELGGAQPIEQFTAIIDSELEAAHRLVREGVRPEAVYRERVAAEKAAAPAPAPEPADTKVYRVPIAGSPVSGPADALVTIVEFGDFQCPFCKRVQATLRELESRYKGQIRIVFKNNPLPFHEHAMPAAELALEARREHGDKGFFEVGAALFAADNMEDADLLAIAKTAKLDLGRARAALRKTSDASIDRDQMLAMDFSADGTPHFFINGRRLAGAQPVEEFVNLIEPALAQAKELVASGVAPSGVYDKIMATAAGPPELDKKPIPPLTARNPSRGPLTAPIVIHEFGDFQCPFCKRVEATLHDLDRVYPGQLRFVWHNMPLPFHQYADAAANAAMEAFAERGPAGFWAMHDLLFDNQDKADGLVRGSLENYARRVGLDAKRFGAALDGSTHRAEIDADQKLANSEGITGTPAFVINGYFVSGAQPLPMFRRVIERALDDNKKQRGPAARTP